MFINRLSMYTLADLKELFSSHPYLNSLSEVDKREIFERAANELRSQYSLIEQIQNSTIVNDRLTYIGTTDDDISINVLKDSDRDALRLSLKTFYLIDSTLQYNRYLEGFNEAQRLMIYAVAQNEYSKLMNDSDAPNYSLWYVSGTYKSDETEDLLFSSSFITSIKDASVVSKDLLFSTSFTAKIGQIGYSLIRDISSKTTFTMIIEPILGITELSKDLVFGTSFVLSDPSAPTQYEVDKDVTSSTTFTTLVHTVYNNTEDVSITTTFITAVV